jgi:DNA repair protein RecN (Recombination protein N)
MASVLEELHVWGLGVVEEARLELGSGLNVLTGETGAGKTLITVGLSLALGARAASGLIRRGRSTLGAEARFRLPAGRVDLEDVEDDPSPVAEANDDEVEVVLARSVSADGRGSARVNGRLVPVAGLAATGGRLVEIHGQNQQTRLLAAAAQTAFLDRFAGPEHQATVDRYKEAHRSLRQAEARLAQLEGAGREREREIDLLRYQIGEIEAARVMPGEIPGLQQEEGRLAHAERILGLAAGAELAVGEESGALDRLREAAAAAQSIVALDPAAAAAAARLASATAEAADALQELRAYRESVDADPARLGEVQERIRALRALERKYGDGEEGILAYLEESRSRLASLESLDADLAGLQEEVRGLTDEVAGLAASVGAVRAKAGPDLAEALRREVRALGMPGAEVTVTLEPLSEPGPLGTEAGEFLFSGGPGQPLQSIARAASGGELSRVMLACRSVRADLDEVPTIVFDEVDAGIGGRTASAVAWRLAQVGRLRQILVVTHLAQIAARADRHFLVEKDAGTATVRLLDGEERVEELARMLSGQTGRASMAHARELIAAGAALSG